MEQPTIDLGTVGAIVAAASILIAAPLIVLVILLFYKSCRANRSHVRTQASLVRYMLQLIISYLYQALNCVWVLD